MSQSQQHKLQWCVKSEGICGRSTGECCSLCASRLEKELNHRMKGGHSHL